MLLATLWLVLLTALCAWLSAGLLGLLLPRLLDRLQAWPARPRAGLLMGLCGAPLLFALSLTLLLAGLPLLPVSAGHCHEGAGCQAHAVQVPGLLGADWRPLLLLIALQLGALLLVLAASGWRQQRWLAWARAPGSRAEAEVIEVDSDQPLAFSSGWWRPRPCISRGLRQQLDPPALAVVIAHERAHARHRHALLRWLARQLLPPLGTRGRRLLEELALAFEQIADEESAGAGGDRTRVADTLLRLQRLHPAVTPAGAGETPALARRVQGLLAPAPVPAGLAWRPWLPLLLALAAALAGAGPLHHGLEQGLPGSALLDGRLAGRG